MSLTDMIAKGIKYLLVPEVKEYPIDWDPTTEQDQKFFRELEAYQPTAEAICMNYSSSFKRIRKF